MGRCRLLSVMVLGAGVALGACSSSTKSSIPPSSASGTTSTTSVAISTPESTTTSSSVSGAVTDTLGVATVAGKRVIVSASGKTVYLYVPDGTSTTSRVPADLKGAWPPVTVSGTPIVGSGLDNTKMALEPQADGTKQVAYNGHLLYTFAGDSGPGTARGEAEAGVWYVLSPAGAKA
jgi:predicted lipoprotein with Yx(FWY)xxD motif